METAARKLLIVAVFNLLGFVVELVGGLLFGSVALVSDALHMLFDSFSYIMAFATRWIASNKEGTDTWTYGFHRLEVLSAFINGATLVPMALLIFVESYRRFLSPVSIDVVNVLYVAVFGLAINVVSVLVLERDEMSLNERGAYFHLLGDAGGSVAVIVGALAIQYTGRYVIDPIVAVLIAMLVLGSAFAVLKRSLGIMLQKSPVPASEVEEAIESIEGVDDAHDIRVWEVCSQVCIATVHAVVSIDDLEKASGIREAIRHELKERFGIQHVTVQVEREPSEESTEHREDHVH